MKTSILKKNILAALVVALAFTSLSSCSKSKSDPSNNVIIKTDTVVKPVYALVWSDEFDEADIDATKWGFDLGNLGVNNEKEFYQAKNAAIANGNLVITANKELVSGQPYTSARMKTQDKFSMTYGRIEARIKLPMGQGMWPAFWMLGANINTVSWPQCGEIDIMEHINANNVIYGTMHWNNNGHVSYGNTTMSTPADYHVYAVEWDSKQIRWYVDDTLFQTGNIYGNVNNTGAFHLPFFILLNLAVGGDFPGATVDESILPASMYVDYVRVYKQTN
ncbi:glycoside hydrolase family 16 protein [Mucilaginibacter sp.]|jgi:beta-glucanase (GH16 family)|uniref:glycoside hydrolase family 16 protein n=1 Tax=Mucilaginibacter sp. TaxID=1882438 RepID=UPI002BBD82D8|nr:glycoside hydrolase family 16 protein [Mucilaginibacter sp.]HTI57654.1 glycoside hydrolase family 16 protein [Mucilaginibacter sp.]